MMILSRIGFDRTTIKIDPDPAMPAGAPTRSASSSALPSTGCSSKRRVLLRWIVYAGFAFAGLSLAAVTIGFWLSSDPVAGGTSLVVLMLPLCSFPIISTGVTALCAGKIFEQAEGRPLYIVDRVSGEASWSMPSEHRGPKPRSWGIAPCRSGARLV